VKCPDFKKIDENRIKETDEAENFIRTFLELVERTRAVSQLKKTKKKFKVKKKSKQKMESFNNSNNANIERAQQQKKLQKIKMILKKALKCINKKKKIVEEIRSEIDDNNFNEMLERRMEEQQNLANEQIIGKQEQASSYCFVENEHGKFYWSSDINRFVAVDCDLIAPAHCETSLQQPQVQCC
jgi:hypothetical protein